LAATPLWQGSRRILGQRTHFPSLGDGCLPLRPWLAHPSLDCSATAVSCGPTNWATPKVPRSENTVIRSWRSLKVQRPTTRAVLYNLLYGWTSTIGADPRHGQATQGFNRQILDRVDCCNGDAVRSSGSLYLLSRQYSVWVSSPLSRCTDVLRIFLRIL
jgi:hypothetical protein